MTGESTPSVGPGEVEAARVLLAKLGVRPEDLLSAPVQAPVVSGAVSVGTRRVYGSYWKRLVQQWGERRLDEPTASEIKGFAERVKENVVVRRNARGGRCAAEHFIVALRCVYQHAVADGVIAEVDNPARKVPKPRRLPSRRRGLAEVRVAEINRVAASTGDDPALDTLLLRLHVETACRRGGALALRPRDLDPEGCQITLREKGDTSRWQPVSPTLMRHLLAHAAERGAGGMRSCCVTAMVTRSPGGGMTICGRGWENSCRGSLGSRSVPTGCGIRR
jgi:integrase